MGLAEGVGSGSGVGSTKAILSQVQVWARVGWSWALCVPEAPNTVLDGPETGAGIVQCPRSGTDLTGAPCGLPFRCVLVVFQP